MRARTAGDKRRCPGRGQNLALLFALAVALLLTDTWRDPIRASASPEVGGWSGKMDIAAQRAPRPSGDFPQFPDVKGHWAAPAIGRAAQRGFVGGFPDGHFRPDRPITRAEFFRVLTSAFGLTSPGRPDEAAAGPADTTGSFADLAGHWAAPYVGAAVAAGIVDRDMYPCDCFQPERPVTRLEMTVLVVNALGKRQEAAQADSREVARGYLDHTSVPEYLRGYVGVATRLGITTGIPGSRFGPDDEASRAQATVMVMRAVDSQEAAQAAVGFFRCWANLDPEGMALLMLIPPNKLIPSSRIVFAPFYPDPKNYSQDLPDFLRASRDLVRQYDERAWENPLVIESRVEPSTFPARARVHLRLGNAPYDIWAEMELTDGGPAGWRVKMIDSQPVPSRAEAPPSSLSLDHLLPVEVRSLDATPGAEVLGWALWDRYEGVGPEPSGAWGIYSFRQSKLQRLWFTTEGPTAGWVWTGGGGVMGHLTSPDDFDLLLVSRPAMVDGKPSSPEGLRLGLYRLLVDEDGAANPTVGTVPSGKAGEQPLEKVADISWPQVAPSDTSVYYGLMAARPLDDIPGDEVIVSAFCIPPQGSRYQLVAICRLEGNTLRVLASYRSPGGEPLHVTFAGSPDAARDGSLAPCRMYLWTAGGGEVTALTFRPGASPTFSALPVCHETVQAAGDIDGDGEDEFLVEAPRHRLQVVDPDGAILWQTTAYKGIGQGWMGLANGKAVVVAAEPGADANRVVRWEGAPPGSTPPAPPGAASSQPGIALDRVWESPPLGRSHISSLWVTDLQEDGDLEILVTSSDSHLTNADRLHIFDFASGALLPAGHQAGRD